MALTRNASTAPRLLTALLLTAMGLSACVGKAPAPPMAVTFVPEAGAFVSTAGEPLPFEAVVAMARGADYVLVGEGHTSVCDHGVQQRLLAALAASKTPPAVGLEMIAVDKQPVLDDFAKGQVPLDGLAEELEWSSRWGYPFSLFEGLFGIAQQHSLPVAGLNVPPALTRKVAREGLEGLSDAERGLLPTRIVPPLPAQREYLGAVFAQHESRDADNAQQRERFDLVQSIWDSSMAQEAVRLRRTYGWPVFIVAGSGHVEYGWGIAHRLARFDPEAKVLLVMPWRGGDFDPAAGDVFFYCPQTHVSRLGMTLVVTGQGGLLVHRVVRDSRADRAGLRPGDVLVEASGVELNQLFDLHRAGFAVHEAGQDLVFTLRRGGQTFQANVGRLGPGPGGESDSGQSGSRESDSGESGPGESGEGTVREGAPAPGH